MNIYIYSDESGVLDKQHNRYYVFGGLIFLSGDERDVCSRRFIAAEKNVRLSEKIELGAEVKACNIQPKSKNKLYHILESEERFGVVINQKELVKDELFSNKKSKQRYLDWAYKMAVKTKLQEMVSQGIIMPQEVESISFLVDEHSTATDGWYELRESLEKEFKIGMWNYEYMTFHKPLFPSVKSLNLQYCNSAKNTLVRAADIVANHIFYLANKNDGLVSSENKLHIFYHPLSQ